MYKVLFSGLLLSALLVGCIKKAEAPVTTPTPSPISIPSPAEKDLSDSIDSLKGSLSEVEDKLGDEVDDVSNEAGSLLEEIGNGLRDKKK